MEEINVIVVEQLSAEGYAQQSEEAKTASQEAQAAAELAQTGAETAQSAAEAAQTAAELAKSGAEAAAGNAAGDVTEQLQQYVQDANTAKQGAQTAQGLAETAAGTATTKAGEALTSANNADSARQAAQTAQGLAQTAKTGAEAARDTALANNELLGGIAHNAAAPTPGKSGKYSFTSSGSCSWITGGAVSVAVGDEVVVVFSSGSYTYTRVARPDIEQARSQSTTKTPSSKLMDDELNVIQNAISYLSEISLSNPTDPGSYFNRNATTKSSAKTASTGYNAHSILVSKGQKYKATALLGGTSMAMAIFYDTSGNKVNHYLAGDNQLHENETITVPDLSYEMVFCWAVSGAKSLSEIKYNIGNKLTDLEAEIQDVETVANDAKNTSENTSSQLDKVTFYKNKYDYETIGVVSGVITTNGNIYPSGFRTGLIPVLPNRYYFLSNRKSNAVPSIRCLAADGVTVTKVRVAQTGEEPSAGIYYYLPSENGLTYASNGQFKTSPTAAYIEITLTELAATQIGEDYKIMLEDVGASYNSEFEYSEYIEHKLSVIDYGLEYPVKPLSERVTQIEEKKKLKVLLIGSSHGMNTIGQFPIIAYNSGIDVICANAYQGSLSLLQVRNYCVNGGNFGGSYKKFSDGLWRDNGVKTILQIVQDEQWDFISIQRSASEDMTWTNDQAGYFETILAFITANCNHAPTVVFNSGFADSYSIANRAAQQADTNTIMSTAQNVKTNYGIEVIPTAPALQAVRNNDTLAGLGTYVDKMLSCDNQHLDQGIGMYVTGCICFNFFLKHLRRSIITCKYLPTIADMTPFWYDVEKFTAIDEQYAKEIRKIVNAYFLNN